MSVKYKLISLILVTVMLAAMFVLPAGASAAGIQYKLNTILEVYPEGSYFTSDGGPSGGSQNSKCSLDNIPSRGGLPAGSVVTAVDGLGYCYSCRAFANYVFYILYGCNFCNSKNTSVDADELVIGDYIRFNGGQHTAIYLWEDENYYYVYDANGEGTSNCMVMYDHAFSKRSWYISSAYHAYNYDTVAGSKSAEYYSLQADSYSLVNVKSGSYIGAGFTMQSAAPSSYNLVVTNSNNAFTIAYASDPKTYLSITTSGSLTTGNEISSYSLWVAEKVEGGVLIHNKGNTNFVLGESDGKLVSAKDMGYMYQKWSIKHNHSYKETVIQKATCTTAGITEYVCSCGDSYRQETDTTNHNYVSVKTVAATDAVCGYTMQKCSNCGAIRRTAFTSRLSTTAKVNTDKVKATLKNVYVDAGVSDEDFWNLFPDFYTGYTGSVVETGVHIYSTIYDESYTVIVVGDYDGDGNSTIVDARGILRTSIGVEEPDTYSIAASDWDGNDEITVVDARYQLRYCVGLENISTFWKNI